MRFLHSLIASTLLVGASLTEAASSWTFNEGSISVTGKGGASSGSKDKLSDRTPLANSIELGAADTAKVLLTATENGKAKRPHQAFLLLKDQDSGIEATFPFQMKETGKGKVEVTQKELPIQLLSSTQPLRATLILASFGSSQAFSNHVFDLLVKADANAPVPMYEKPMRYGKLGEIHHIFKQDAKSGPVVISMFFVLAVLATLPVLFGTWAYLGANVSHLSSAIGSAPVAHTLFFGSILSVEGIFFLYYYNWTLFQMLPVSGLIGLVAFLSGSKALSEVQSRRLAGER